MTKIKKIFLVLTFVVSIVAVLALNTFAVTVDDIVIYNPSVSIQTYSRNQYTTVSTNYGGQISSRFYDDRRTNFWQTGNVDTSTQLTVFSIYEGNEYFTVYQFVSRNSFSANIDFGLLGYIDADVVDSPRYFFVEHAGYVVGNNFDYSVETQPSKLEMSANVTLLDTSYYEGEPISVPQLSTVSYSPNDTQFSRLFYSDHGDQFIKSINFRVDYDQDLIDQGYSNQTFAYYVQVRSSSPMFTDNYNSIEYFDDRNTDYVISTSYDNGLSKAEELIDDGVFGFVISSVESFLSAEIFPGFSFGLLLTCIAGLSLFIWFLKIFAGG